MAKKTKSNKKDASKPKAKKQNPKTKASKAEAVAPNSGSKDVTEVENLEEVRPKG